MVQTVLGQVHANELGPTMMHEHLTPRNMVETPPQWSPFVPGEGHEAVEREMHRLRRLGVETVVDVTPFGKGRDPAWLRTLSERTEVKIVCATGFYKEPSCPGFVHQSDVAAIARFMLDEVERGIDGSGVRPGIIKVGSSKGVITPTERKVFVAAAVVHRETGLPITTHTTLGTMGREQVDLLSEHGVDPARVIVGHSDLNAVPAYHREILKTGATVAFDTIGKEHFHYRRHREAGYERYAYLLEAYHVPDDDRERLLRTLLADGERRIVLSSDILWSEALANAPTIGVWGYAYLVERFLPRLREHGVDEGSIETMMRHNPSRLLDAA